ncbi:MAG: polyprenyl synthetase family protein [Paludibacter sp.]
MNFIDNIRKPIIAEMQLFAKAFGEALTTDNSLLLSVNEYVLQKSGKQLRPMLVLLSAKMCGEVNYSTINGALSLELLHTATLIHDDVVDDTLERRGKPSINAKWTNKIAVLSGDYIFAKSLECGTNTDSLAVMKSISEMGKQLSDGELLQLENAQFSDTSEENYYTIIRKKTALLFATCAEVGGISVNADADSLVHLRNFGEYMGLCFQIKDDVFDYFDDIEIGKPTGNDIRDGKVTLPLIYALQNSTVEERKSIVTMLDNKDFSTENVQTITKFTLQKGGVEYAIEQMEAYKNKAIEELNGFADSEMKQSLIMCAEFAASRNV